MIAVFLLDFGGPEKLQDVRPFLRNLFADRSIFPFPFAQNFFASLVSFLRAPKVAKHYLAIGGGSPLPKQSKHIAAQLEDGLKKTALDFKVFVGMRYWNPYIKDTLREIADAKPQGMVVIPMFPHYSTATTGSVFAAFEAAYAEIGLNIPYQKIDWWYDQPQYIAAWCYTIKRALDQFPEGGRSKIPILFTAHSLPESFVRKRKDPYPTQIKECCEKIITYLGGEHPSYLSYQSKVGPIEWLKPSTIEFVKELGGRGMKELVVVPISFLTDHFETLYEIDHLIIPEAQTAGIQQTVRCEALYYTPYLTKALEEMALKKLPPLLESNKSA